jgi:DNA helicase-2/ATP-dependent DNA helicase PcrA
MFDFTPTDEQRDILAHALNRHARILAGPGTGKSATLVALVNNLLSGSGDPTPRIKLLTFTRAATSELARKISEHPAAGAQRPSTIHSFAISALLRNPGSGDFPEPLRIADTWEQDEIVFPSLERRAAISRKDRERLIQEMASNWESLRPEKDSRVDQAVRARFLGAWYEHRQVYGYTLLAELPYDLRMALSQHPEFEGVDYDLLVVDEYQDLNACDLEVIRLMAQRGCSVIAAGDDDQSIYSFRKAFPEGIRRFPDDYPGVVDYPLSVTQRCGRRVVEWANWLIVGDPNRPPNRPILTCADEAPEGQVALLSFGSQDSEAYGVARIVQGLSAQVDPRDVLVLLRSDYRGTFSQPIRQHLGALGIPCSDPEAVNRICGEPNNRRVIAACRLLSHRQDSIAWASLLWLAGGIGAAFIEHVYQRAKASHCQFGEALLAEHAAGFPGAPRSAEAARQLLQGVLGWLDSHPMLDQEPEQGWGRWILDVAGDRIVPPPTDGFATLLQRLDEVSESGQSLERYVAQVYPLAKDLALAESNGVRVMTLGGAKGLTARAVIIPAAEEGLIPRPDCDLSEERRLLYVGMTRAREYLYCTWARRRTGPTARAGRARVGTMRHYSSFLRGGPVASQDGSAFLTG